MLHPEYAINMKNVILSVIFHAKGTEQEELFQLN